MPFALHPFAEFTPPLSLEGDRETRRAFASLES
jgi:hypothetical protein